MSYIWEKTNGTLGKKKKKRRDSNTLNECYYNIFEYKESH